MMTAEEFALWKFKTTEGVLDGFHAGDFLTTKFHKDAKHEYEIHYDVKNSICTIINTQETNPMPRFCKFSELVDVLKEMDVYYERTLNRHASSYIPYRGKVE